MIYTESVALVALSFKEYVKESWKTIEERQITFDETEDIDERVRLRNLITQQKARMYTSIR